MTKVNELGQQILKAKYYAPGETEPEHLFRRVAKVCSIPDVIDYLIQSRMPNDSNTSCGVTISNDYLHTIFGEYDYLAKRVIERRGITDLIVQAGLLGYLTAPNEVWEECANKYFEAMANLDFLPASPTLMNAGLGGMLSSCFAIRVPDSMEGIFEVVKQVAIISQKGGGVGLQMSEVRPEGCPISGTGGTASGPISFMKVFNESGNQVKQGGRRKAALLGGLDVNHPDILKFITCKDSEGTLENFNMSIFISDEFMQAVEDDSNIDLTHPKLLRVTTVRARTIWDAIIKQAWKNGEPGIIFQGNFDKDDIMRGKYGKLLCNPCVELPLHNYSSCNLASINLSNCYAGNRIIDYDKLVKLTKLVTRFLDNVVDLNNYPLPQIADMTLKLRPIGIGTMGLHDLLLKCESEYGSEGSLNIIKSVYGAMKQISEDESVILGKARGVPQDLKDVGLGRRNGFLRTIPPTGTISMIANQVSSGIEPVFQWEYTRKDSYGTHKIRHFMLDKFGSVGALPNYAKTALEIAPEAHVKVQAQIQQYLDESASKTINLPNHATIEDVDKIYKMAYKTGCKSITVYRSGSRINEVLNKDDKKEPEHQEQPKVQEVLSKEDEIRARPRILFGATIRVNYNTPMYITINEDSVGVREVFINAGRCGTEVAAHLEAIGRMISNSFKYNIPCDVIARQLRGIRSNQIFSAGKIIRSIPDGIAQALQEYADFYEGFSQYIEDPIIAKSIEDTSHLDTLTKQTGDLCQDCGELLYHEGSCEVCKSCGWSKCG